LITYDDTGGWYDHADIPTNGVPRPDDYPACSGTIDFNWLGMRTPTLLVTPWVSKGKVVHDPSGPTPTSLYEHTSLAATLKSLFNLTSFLTKRDAWAGDFSKELDLDAPRTDCPMHMPDAPTPSEKKGTHGAVDPAVKLTRRQARRIAGLARVNGIPEPKITSHPEAEKWIADQEAIHRNRLLQPEIEL